MEVACERIWMYYIVLTFNDGHKPVRAPRKAVNHQLPDVFALQIHCRSQAAVLDTARLQLFAILRCRFCTGHGSSVHRRAACGAGVLQAGIVMFDRVGQGS
jgi:hypothetical protein